MMIRLAPLALPVLIAVAGCAGQAPAPPTTVAAPAPVAPVATGNPVRPEMLDTATAAEKAAALAPAAVRAQALGTAVASLGDVTEPGFWVKSPLVAVQGPGRIELAATGQSAAVTLIPVSEGGTEVSLSVLRALGVPLTDLPEVTLFATPDG
jgi:hypothetical protein